MMDPKVFDPFNSNERTVKAVSRILAKRYDVESWIILTKEASAKAIEEVESFYEELIQTFPTCGKFWRLYIEHEMKHKRYDKVSKLFQRSLEEVLSIDLYKCYLNYVREVKVNEPDLIRKAFCYTLDRVGSDPNAISIYNDYIQFLKEREVDGQYLDSQRLLAIKKAYQEGVMNPMFHVDTLWKEYITFEQNISSSMAEKAVQDRSRDHMNVRRVAKEWEITIRGLNRAWPACPPSFEPAETRQIEIWRRYIQWEKSNPTRTENNQIIVKRVSYAYKQYLLCFGHHPNVWHEYAAYLNEQAKLLSDKESELARKLLKEEAMLFERAIKGLMKGNLLIHFSYADFEEIRNDKKRALEIYNNLIDYLKDSKDSNLTLAYIQLMRFTRRTDGLKPARVIFKRAREEENCSHQIYTAAALMEYHCTKDHTISCKIFDLGLKKFSSSPDYILSYIHFMNSLNEENNTRVLFERVLTTCSLQPNDTIEIWNNFIEFEAAIGDLSSINKIERRRTVALEQTLPRSTESSWAIDKYRFQDLYPCSLAELKSLNYDSQQCSTSLPSLTHLISSLDNSNGGSLQPHLSGGGSNGILGRKTKLAARGSNTKGLNASDGLLVDQIDCDDFGASILSNQTSMCQPDLDQMLPFKPVASAGYGDHAVPGGVFPPPPAVGGLLARLPQAGSFWGPFVDIEELSNIIRETNFDELFGNLVEHRRDNSKPRAKKQRVE